MHNGVVKGKRDITIGINGVPKRRHNKCSVETFEKNELGFNLACCRG